MACCIGEDTGTTLINLNTIPENGTNRAPRHEPRIVVHALPKSCAQPLYFNVKNKQP